MSASDRLRQAIEALTEGERYAGPWHATQDGGDHWWVQAGGLSIANFGLGDTARSAAEHVALLASPTVGAALADLLDAIRGDAVDWRGLPAAESSAEWGRRIFDARDALEQAIERSGQ